MSLRHDRARERFEPLHLTSDDLEDLSAFTGLPVHDCNERVRSYSLAEMSLAWRAANPQTSQEMLAFYGSTDLYIWEQAQWHASPDRASYWEALERLSTRFPANAGYKRVLDFGAGIGTDAAYLAERGYSVTLVDVPGPAFRFARHRFERRGLKGTFLESRSHLPVPDREYDVVVCFDVFEHLVDPLEAARRLVACLRPDGVMLQTGAFKDEGNHPCHLPDGIERFGGARWSIYLAGLGLRGIGDGLLAKSNRTLAAIQRLRYLMWRRTGLWLIRLRP
jgi:2-polyprenyl-3-methyl-5-hydroxy-6-metoxy-1,4-benzoquinol methylase